MKIGKIKINGVTNPVGYFMDSVRVSWLVTETAAKKAASSKVEVSTDSDFQAIVCAVEGELNNACTVLDMELSPRTSYYVRVSVVADNGEKAQSLAGFETSKMDEPWVAQWIEPAPDEDANIVEQEENPMHQVRHVAEEFHPVFEKTFEAKASVQSARLYISGLGLYVARLNGARIGSECLAPCYSDYHTEVQYQTYDVTGLLAKDNKLSVELGNGWYKGTFGLAGQKNNYGSAFQLIAELRIAYADGSEEIIASDESWTYRGADTTVSDIYDGEVINRLAWMGKENPPKAPVIGGIEGRLIARRSLPVMEKESLPVKEVIRTPVGETVLDFGQNYAGYVSFHVKQPRGARIVLDFGEILQNGNFYNANYRSAKSQFSYISNGQEEWVTPQFTFFGFRYVRVTGWIGKLDPQDFVGKALYSDMETTGHIETGHKKLNRLFLNALWGQKSNSIDIATDCPQRDERLGWTGDAQVFSGTGCYNMDASAFYNKFCHDLYVEQTKLGGLMPGVIPVLEPNNIAFSAVWGDIATFLPVTLFERYGDLKDLENNYPMMKAWVDYIDTEDKKRGHNYLFNFSAQLGDWLALDGRTEQSLQGATDAYFIGSCYYAMSVKKLAEAAKALGYEQDAEKYQKLHENIVCAVLNDFYTATGKLAIDTQTGYLVALYSGVYRDKQVVVDAMRERLYKDCFKIKGGFVGAPIMCKVLAENGLMDEAFYYLLQEGYPGWLHCVDLGATTIWERWNSVLDDGLLSGTMMNSLNHYAFGAVIEFLYAYVAGIRPLLPGFKKAVLAPNPDSRLGWLKSSYKSRCGTYRSEWEIEEDGMLNITLEIPFGCTAQVDLPYYGGETIGELGAGIYRYRYQPTHNLLSRYNTKTLIVDMMKDEKTAAVIRETSPLLAWYLDTGNTDYLYENLTTLRRMFFMGFTKEEVDKLEAAVLAIK